MSKKYTHINHLTAAQMQAYASHQLTEAEAHEVEKHALQCPFCAEALEGVELSMEKHGFADDVEILKTRIENEAQEESVTPFPWQQLAAAVIVLALLIGGGYGIYSWSSSTPLDQLAEQKKEEEPKEKQEVKKQTPVDSAAQAISDTSMVETDSLKNKKSEINPKDQEPIPTNLQNPIQLASNNPSPTAETKDELSIQSFANEQPMVEMVEEVEETLSPKQTEELATSDMMDEELKADEATIEKPTRKVSGTVKTSSGEPIPFASVALQGTERGVSTDMDGNFSIQTQEDTLDLLISSVGLESKRMLVPPRENRVQVIMKENAVALEEVVVVQSEQKMLNSTLNSLSIKEKGTSVLATPKGGWVAFNEYLEKKKIIPSAAKDNNISGAVELSFSIKRGKPTDIKVEKSLGYGCDEEAKRLLKEGPKWEGDRGSVRVEF